MWQVLSVTSVPSNIKGAKALRGRERKEAAPRGVCTGLKRMRTKEDVL